MDFPTQILVEQYNLAHKQLFEALSDNEFPVDPILFKNKKEQFAALQRNQIQIIAFLEEQRKNRKEFLDFKEKFKNHTPFVLTNTTSKEKALSFEGANYTLNYSTQHMVERYNYLYERLTKFFKNYSSTSNPLMINAELLQKITKQFIQLIESQNEIKSFVEKQRELDDLRNRFAAFSPLTLTYEGNSLVYKEKTYPLNAAIAKQIQEYNQAYGELEQAFKGENSTLDIESIKKLFNKLQQKVKPFDQIEEFGKLTKLLEKQSDLVNKRKRIVQEIIDKIKLESLGDVSKDSEEVTILKGLLQAFTRHDAEVTQLVAKIGTARNDLCLDNLSDSKEQLKKFATANHDKAGDLIKDLREEFNENLPKFSSNKRLNQFMAWIDKHILAPLYEAYYKEEKPYKPGFFASSIERNLFEFRKNLFPDLEKFQNELSEAAKAASAA
ncbi:hypothetical protein [Legionella qingyii]|uniref:Uncharacterized protein n=1 Tax=Legionella qingyii TaxID=2184757 RepID=A0ABY0CLZ7_9GAMM|nr:hypothetical protein [Legionella qingyii]RUR26433.1 hypothetical protein ELY20_00495 [Legionella qingyii]RUR27453.1 hypothetical protein ELY16_04840 [Legionella qingyii]